MRALLLVHSDPAPLEAFMALHVQTHLPPGPEATRNQPEDVQGLGYIHGGYKLQSVHLTVCFHLSCLCMTGYGPPVV